MDISTILLYQSLYNAHILYWTIIGIGIFLLYSVNNIKPADYLAEHGIFSVQMGCSAYHLIVVRHEMIVFIAFFFPGRTHLVERGWSHLPAPDDIELTATAVAFGIDIIAFTGGVGENQTPTRRNICRSLEYLGVKIDEELNDKLWRGKEGEISTPDSKVKVVVVMTDEEYMIAHDTEAIIEGREP